MLEASPPAKTPATEQKQEEKSKEMATILDRDQEEVLAEYPGGKVKRKDLVEQIKSTGMNIDSPQPTRVIDELESRLALTLMLQNYISPIAKKAGLDKDVTQLIEFLTKQIIYSQYLTKKAKDMVKEDDIKALYEKQRNEMKDEVMFNLAACIVKDEATAKAVIKAIKGKAKKDQRAEFVNQVMSKSILEETKRQEGALPPLTKARLPMLFGKSSDEIAKYGKDALIPKPLKVKDSWFVVYVNDKNKVGETMQPYEKIKDEVNQLFRPQVERSKRVEVLKDMVKSGTFKVRIAGEMKSVGELPDNLLTAAIS